MLSKGSHSKDTRSETKAPRQAVDWRTVCIVASALALLILSTPGVRVVQASGDIDLLSAGQTCEAPALGVVTSIDQDLKRMRLAGPSGKPVGEHSYALNNRGYNYGPIPPERRPSQGVPPLTR